MKRKLETSNSEPISINGDEHSPPKKRKILKNEQRGKKQINNDTDKVEKRVEDPETLARTVFVGNLPIETDKDKIKKHFKKFGEIESVRIRGIPVANPNMSKKVAAIKKEFNPKRSNVFCYIRFENKEDALKAEAENGALFGEHHLRVHCCGDDKKPDESKAIFVGNLSFEATEDDLWEAFGACGPISYVRIIRHAHSGMAKGFGFVNFKDSDAVQLALEMENVVIRERELRISLCTLNASRKKKFTKNNRIFQAGKQTLKKSKKISSDKKASPANKGFQGTKFSDKKKKNKVNKGLLGKKKLMKKIAPKPKIIKE